MDGRVNLAQLLLEWLELLLMRTILRSKRNEFPTNADETLVYWYKLNVQHRQRLL